jgi:hypothetical protein
VVLLGALTALALAWPALQSPARRPARPVKDALASGNLLDGTAARVGAFICAYASDIRSWSVARAVGMSAALAVSQMGTIAQSGGGPFCRQLPGHSER